MSERLIINKNQPQVDGIIDSSQLLQILTTENHPISEFNEFVAPVGNMVVGNDGRYTYTSHLVNPYEREHWWIPMDHCYARPWNWRPESTFLRPTKTLFMPKPPPKRKSNPLALLQGFEDLIDVVTESEEPAPIYDKAKAKQLMEECERHAALSRVDEDEEDWEENVSRLNWTPTQNRLFSSMVSILNSDQLARLAQTDSHNEPVARRITIDKSVDRVRRLMATVSWDIKYTQWLHQLLIDNLSTQYLAVYLDILQTLRSKLPTFVDKMMSGVNASRLTLLGYENLFPLLKRQWDPIASSLMQDKPKKLPANPVIVVVPSTPISSKRMLKWINLLSNLATVITIPSNYGGGPSHKTAMMNCVDQMFVMTRNKIQDIRLDYPGRNIVLVGFGFGATLALQIAQVEQVLCVISIGFSLLTAEGRRGEPDDNLLELQCPVLFVNGQCSMTSGQEDMEDLRERMRVETGLIIVGSADDNLRVNKKKKKMEGITQSVVDRCVADEIGEFISGIILSPYPPQIRQSPTNLTTDGIMAKKVKTERKRYNSNTSSVDSEPPSPTPRITRPVGRPPGSKGKVKMEPKWAAQAKAMGLQNRSLSSLLQGDFQTLTQPSLVKSGPSGIRVLENVKLSSGAPPKVFSNNGKMLDMSKISVINTKTTNGNSLVLLPDGKIKNVSPNLKVPGGRYITSKRQLLGNKPPKPAKKNSYLQQQCSIPTASLPPPTNLTTQDIMDLPIIFADDNQMLDNAQTEVKPIPHLVPSSAPSKLISGNAANKFMVINKPNFIISQGAKTASSTPPTKGQPKYTKIILSSKKLPDQTVKKIPSEIPVTSVQSETPMEEFDLENEIAASTLYKRKIDGTDGERLEIVTKKPEDCDSISELAMTSRQPLKRSAEEAQSGVGGTPNKLSRLDV